MTNDQQQSSLTIGNIEGGIHDSILAGRDVKVILQVVQQAGLSLPSPRNQAALLHTLRQSVKNATSSVEKTALSETIEALEQALEALPGHEQDYRRRVHNRYTTEATYYVELTGTTSEVDKQLTKTSRSARRRQKRALADYCEWQHDGREIRRVKLDTLREGVNKYPTIILLGDPGSGKTTALENLAYQFAAEKTPPLLEDAKRGEGVIPLFLRLSEFGPGQTVAEFVSQSWAGSEQAGHWGAPELAANLDGYLEQGRLFILFDALNEMPRQGYPDRARELRSFVDRWQAKGNRFIVSCRLLDYGQELQGLQRVEVQPLTPEQIKELLQRELPHDWPELWQVLTTTDQHTGRQALLDLAKNPWMLTIIIDVYESNETLPASRAELMHQFVQIQMEDARHKPHLADIWLDATAQQQALSVTAFEMQDRAGSGAAVPTTLVKTEMPAEVQPNPKWGAVPTPPDQILTLAAGANIIEMPVDRSSVRFYHQLLQEYFAAREMLGRLKQAELSGFENLITLDPDTLWRWPWLETEMPPPGPYKYPDPLPPPPPTGWEETTILAAGLAPENDVQLVRTLLAVNPVLAGRCLHEGQARVDRTTRQSVIQTLLTAIANPAVALRVRIAVGQVLGFLGDPRLGEMVSIPQGKFVMGSGEGDDLADEDEKPQHKLILPDYQIARFPLTNAEYGSFIEAGGYRQQRWWTEAGWQRKEEGNWIEPGYWNDNRFNKPNQPIVGISWHEAVAYCRWQSAETGQTVRLPTEAEWEKAARGSKGNIHPWGNEFDATRVNMDFGEQVVNTTTPVGIYPGGRSPYGIDDCAGNVWEWCATKRGKSYPYDIKENEWREEYLNGTDVRVLRGGSWLNHNEYFARCAFRRGFNPYDRDFNWGCRLVVSPII